MGMLHGTVFIPSFIRGHTEVCLIDTKLPVHFLLYGSYLHDSVVMVLTSCCSHC